MTPVAAKNTSSPETRSSVMQHPVEVVAQVERGAALVVVARPEAALDRAAEALEPAAAITPSGVPPMPNSTSMPELRQATEIAPATSPSWMSLMRAPASRHSRMMSAWRSRSRMTAVTSLTLLAERLRHRFEVGLHRRVDVDHVGRGRAGRDLLHVDARARG